MKYTKTFLVLFLALMLCFAFAACGGEEEPAAEPEVSEEVTAEDTAAEQVACDLSVVPADAELIPYDTFFNAFKEFNTRSENMETMTLADIESMFGAEGYYYPECDWNNGFFDQKTYAWFSDEPYGSGNVAIAFVFTCKDDGSLEYYSYVSNGITIWDLEEGS